jgi:hypothetical protein
MRRGLIVVLLVALMLTVGCGGDDDHGSAAPTTAEADIYVQVLRSFLSTVATEMSIPDQAFTTVYVHDQAFPDAADALGRHKRGTPITPTTQDQITAALAGVAHVVFITNPDTVIETRDDCEQVPDGGILITLGTPIGGAHLIHVGINGFVACLNATWLTYVVRNQSGAGWRVTGTTGEFSVA